MSETVLLLAGILLALLALIVLAAISVTESAPPAKALRTVRTAVEVWCPATGDRTRVRIGIDAAARSLSVLWCERFEDPVTACDRGCFPSQPLEATA